MRSRTSAALVLAIVALMGPGRALAQAQATDQDPVIGDLRRQLEELRVQLAVIQSRIDELTAAGPGAASTPGTVAEQTQPARPAERVTSSQASQATSTYQTVSEDAFAAARFDNAPMDPKYRGYFILPGTQTLLKIWNPFGTLDIGAEHLLRWYERKDRQTGTASRIQVSLKYAFVRVDGGE